MILDRIKEDKEKDYEKLLEQLRFDEERLTALLKMSQLKGLSEKEYIDYTLEECVRLTKSKVGYLHFVNEDQESLSLYTWSKDVLKNCTAEKVPHYPISEAGIWADCFRERRPVIHNDYPNYPHKKGYPEGHFPVLRHISIPVFDGENIVAIVGVGNKEDPYDDSDTRQLYLFMDRMWRIIKQNKADELLKCSERKYREAYERAEFFRKLLAHDIRNILQVISSSAVILPIILKDIESTEKLEEIVNKIQSQVFRGADLIKNVCTLSDIQNINLKKIELISVIKETIDHFSKSSLEKKVKITLDNSLESFYIAANDLLIDIFENLINNAIHHNKMEQVNIEIKTSTLKEEERRLIKLEFIDNGIGIPDTLKESILKGDYTKRKESQGLGIGLILILTLVKSFHGNLYIEDKVKGDPSKGTNFILIFPEIKK